MPLIPILGRQKQESNHKSEASPVFIAGQECAAEPCFRTATKKSCSGGSSGGSRSAGDA